VVERWGYPRAVGSQTVAVAGKERCGKLGPSRLAGSNRSKNPLCLEARAALSFTWSCAVHVTCERRLSIFELLLPSISSHRILGLKPPGIRWVDSRQPEWMSTSHRDHSFQVYPPYMPKFVEQMISLVLAC
jgi:hypothetical protein